jgi:metal-responsive CopG/Arc/MetJ family transcriptional regulator
MQLASALGSYEDAVQGPDKPRMTKVSVTVDRGLLVFVDSYVQSQNDVSRSEIFDQALDMWVRHMQQQADIACYSTKPTNEQSKAAADWSAIQTEAAKHIW